MRFSSLDFITVSFFGKSTNSKIQVFFRSTKELKFALKYNIHLALMVRGILYFSGI